MSRLRFPEGFFWGASTSSHQVEGGQENDWTAWEALGKTKDKSVSGLACDHWNRFAADFDIAKGLGHTAHRFSIEWSRIEPREGEWNESALEHYRQVIKALRDRTIEPFVTLWHFTSPQWFMRRGGWESADAPQIFARYAAKVAAALPEVKYWLTINEANVYALLGYLIGYWPPEVRSFARARRVYHQLALGHNAAAASIKSLAGQAEVGSAHSVVAYEPARPTSTLDRWSSRFADRWYNRRWFDWTAASSDFLGVNHYLRQRIRFGKPWRPIVNEPQGQPQSDFGWEMWPPAMYQVLREAGEYGKPVYVTENGVADAADRWRADFIRDELREVHRAVTDGVDVRGYFHWSLLDNFEWREGYTMRFGLVAVDQATQVRTVRPSAQVFADICRSSQIDA